MTTTDTRADVKNKLTALKKAVSAVTKADKNWLQALEGFLEGIDPNTNDKQQQTINQGVLAVITDALPSTLSNISASALPIDQALRLALDDVTLLQLADRKLGGKVSHLDPNSENLGKAIVEAEAYLVLTDEAFSFLTAICSGTNNAGTLIPGIETIPGIDHTFQTSLTNLRSTANDARNKEPGGLSPLVAGLLQATGPGGSVTLPGKEPEGTELLFGKGLSPCADEFLSLMIPGSKEFTQTQTLLSGSHLTLSDNQINVLTKSWGKAIKQVTDDLATSTPTFTIADLFCIHSSLETLYDRLETNVTRTDVDIVSLEI